MSQQISTLTFFKFNHAGSKIWAFLMMQFAHPAIRNAKGLQFYKLMGSGKGMGFNPFPDWSVYCLLQVWDTEAHALEFFDKSEIMLKYANKSEEIWTVYMKSLVANGSWSGGNPFEKSASLDENNPLIGVITRATIRRRHLRKFWKYVPTSHEQLGSNPGLIYTKGIGEAPLTQMATFSLWKDVSFLRQFAYESKEHQVAIKKTRDLKWYKEELFSRFQPYKSVGTWQGIDPLKGLLP